MIIFDRPVSYLLGDSKCKIFLRIQLFQKFTVLMIPHHRNWTLLKQYDFRFHSARKNKAFLASVTKMHGNKWFGEPKNITWCNGFWMIFKKCLFLKTSISGISPKEQFWICWESKNLFVFPMFLIKLEVGKISRVSEKSFVFPMFLNAFRKRSLFKKWPFQFSPA